ncbi:MAG: hypothetical protein WDN25_00770 [Acetobacteraceae bacterium]
MRSLNSRVSASSSTTSTTPSVRPVTAFRHLLQQLVAVHRLVEEGHRAEFEAQAAIFVGGDQHHRDRGQFRVALQRVQHRPSVDLRHQDVERDRIRPVLARHRQRLRAGARVQQAVAVTRVMRADDVLRRRIIVHHQHRRPALRQ